MQLQGLRALGKRKQRTRAACRHPWPSEPSGLRWWSESPVRDPEKPVASAGVYLEGKRRLRPPKRSNIRRAWKSLTMSVEKRLSNDMSGWQRRRSML